MHVSKDELEPRSSASTRAARSTRRDAHRVRVDAGTVPARRVAVQGPPDDRCQCDHWGYLFKGSFRSPTSTARGDRHAGEAYHLRPGHFVQTLEPVELIELSPVEEHDRTMATIARNMAAVVT